MNKRYLSIFVLFALLSFLYFSETTEAANPPDIISYDATLLQDAIEINVKWQSEYPVIQAQIKAGNTNREIGLDPYDDNVKDPYGYHGEASLMLPVDSSGYYEDYIYYVIQLEDDAGLRSRRISGRLKVSSEVMRELEIGRRDDLTREFIEKDHKREKEGIIDKVIEVMERHDTPPVVNEIIINRSGKKNVSFTSQIMDDKGLGKISFKVFNAEGDLVKEQAITDLGNVWKGTTHTFALDSGTYRVVAQAIDSAGNTSPEKIQEFIISTDEGSLVVSIRPEEAIAAGAGWRANAEDWLGSGSKMTGLKAGKYTVEFKAVTGWSKPDNFDVTIRSGETADITGTYIGQ